MATTTSNLSGSLITVTEAANLLASGRPALVAGDETLLRQLPAGSWIAGTIPYFVSDEGGQVSRDRVYVDLLPPVVSAVKVASYAVDELERIPADAYANGFSVVIVPAGSDVHARYAADAPEFAGLFDQPVVGWVAGVHLDDLATATAKVFAGVAEGSSDHAVVLHAELPEGVIAGADIVNLFSQGDGATLTFDSTGFSQGTVNVDGVSRNFAEYLAEIGADPQLPLVADYFGAMVNVSFQSVPADGGPVALYAPVFSGVEYKLAAPIGDYVSEFEAQLPSGGHPAFACNCILNYLYSELEGKKTGDVVGPVTFGEIAYQLLNQTLVYLTIHE